MTSGWRREWQVRSGRDEQGASKCASKEERRVGGGKRREELLCQGKVSWTAKRLNDILYGHVLGGKFNLSTYSLSTSLSLPINTVIDAFKHEKFALEHVF